MDAPQPTQNQIPNGVSQRGPMAGPSGPAPGMQGNRRAPFAQQQNPQINVGSNERIVSVLGGVVLLGIGLLRRKLSGSLLGLVGGGLLYRGLSGHCHVYGAMGKSTAGPMDQEIHVDKSVTINRPQEEIYRFFRNLENLPRFMKHLQSVKMMSPTRSHWSAKAPGGGAVEWDADIVEEHEPNQISWRSLENADVFNEGTVRFNIAPADRGTEVRVILRYLPPLGKLGALLAKLLGEEPAIQIEEDLHRLKEILETGEIPTTAGQPSGRKLQN
jgi:uncharacterized membrane protein